MKANELTKGQRVTLKNGFQAEIQNNKKGNIRMIDTKGERDAL